MLDNLIPGNSNDVKKYIHYFLEQPNFKQFAEYNLLKIRKKLKGSSNYQDRLDVVAELELAYLLCNKTEEIIYEPNLKGPDFHIKFQNFKKISVEVRRIRQPDNIINKINNITWIDYSQKESFKFTDIIFEKLGKFNNCQPNVLYIRSNSISHDYEELGIAIDHISKQIANNNSIFFKSKGYNNINDIIENFKKISLFVVKDTRLVDEISGEHNLVLPYADSKHWIPENIRHKFKYI